MPDQSSASYYFNLTRRNWWLILALALIVGVAAYSGSRLQGERFRSSATILFTPTSTPTSITSDDPTRAIPTLVGLIPTNSVLEAALPKSGYADTSKLYSNLEVGASSDSNLIRITVSAPSAQQAAAATQAVAQSFLDFVSARERRLVQARIAYLEQQLTALAGSSAPSDVALAAGLQQQLSEAQAQLREPAAELTIVQPAAVPRAPYAPHSARNAIIGLLRDRLDRRLRSIEEVEPIYRAPVLGVVPFIARAARGHRHAALGDYATHSPAAEAFRMIRTNLALFTSDSQTPRVIVVSSAIPEEGKSAAVANLSAAFAASGKSVLAISADVRAPTLHKYFEGGKRLTRKPHAVAAGRADTRSHEPSAQEHGVIEVLSGQVPLSDAVREISLNGSGPDSSSVTLLSSGRQFFDPASLYQSEAMRSLLAEARARYDVVVIDAPPLLVGGDCSVLAQQADAFLLVAQIGRLTRDTARRAARLMDAAQIRPLGVIVTGTKIHASEAYGYGYGYGQAR